MTDNDGFKLVTSKKKRTQPRVLSKTQNSASTPFSISDALDLEKKVNDCKSALENYDQNLYWQKVQLQIKKLLRNYFQASKSNEISLISYGLGSVDENLSSRYQLALFLLLIDEIRSFKEASLNTPELYDPVFNQVDKHLLTSVLGLKVLDNNDQCFRSASISEPTLTSLTIFYMPHCGKALFNNLLYSNWSIPRLTSLAIFGNSFSTIQLNTMDEDMEKFYSYVKDSLQFINACTLDFKCDFTNAFSDFSLQTFENMHMGMKLINNLGSISIKPVYEDSEEIFK